MVYMWSNALFRSNKKYACLHLCFDTLENYSHHKTQFANDDFYTQYLLFVKFFWHFLDVSALWPSSEDLWAGFFSFFVG